MPAKSQWVTIWKNSSGTCFVKQHQTSHEIVVGGAGETVNLIVKGQDLVVVPEES